MWLQWSRVQVPSLTPDILLRKRPSDRAPLAQLVEQLTLNQRVRSSSLRRRIYFQGFLRLHRSVGSFPGAWLGASAAHNHLVAVIRSAPPLRCTGGIDGHPIELKIYDTEGDGTKAVQQFRRLVESDQVDVVFGPSSSGESLLVADAAEEAGVPTILHAGTERVVVPPKK